MIQIPHLCSESSNECGYPEERMAPLDGQLPQIL